MASSLKWITKRAQELYRGGRGMAWKQAIKKASAEYRERKKDGISSIAGRKKKKGRAKKRIGFLYNSKKQNPKYAGLKRSKKELVKRRLSKALLDYELATTVRATRAAQKRKIALRKQLKAL